MNIICADCKRELKENEEYMEYLVGDDKYFKCKPCHQAKPELKNFQPCQVFSRVCGYYQPTSTWNPGKVSEFQDRKTYIGNDIY
jgi:anaerobic ribonucleoside-triphosphate reductase